jgi:lysozyme family protein
MADIDIAVEYVLRQEDSKLSGVITTDLGGRTRFGVAEKFHPELTSTGFYDTMPTAQALEIAISVYKSIYANTLKLNTISDQTVANALLSYAVNVGTVRAVKLLQRTLGLLEDGILGPFTINKIESIMPKNLLIAWKNVMLAYYDDVANDHPTDAIYLNGWINRVNQNSKQQV